MQAYTDLKKNYLGPADRLPRKLPIGPTSLRETSPLHIYYVATLRNSKYKAYVTSYFIVSSSNSKQLHFRNVRNVTSACSKRQPLPPVS